MSIAVQHIIVGVILLASVGWVVHRIASWVGRKDSPSTCNCESCPFAQCDKQKNIPCEHKKVGKKIAHYDK